MGNSMSWLQYKIISREIQLLFRFCHTSIAFWLQFAIYSGFSERKLRFVLSSQCTSSETYHQQLIISSFRNLSPRSNIQGESLPEELNLIRDQVREQILLLLTQLFLNAEFAWQNQLQNSNSFSKSDHMLRKIT